MQALPLPPYTTQRSNELLGLYRQLQKRFWFLRSCSHGRSAAVV